MSWVALSPRESRSYSLARAIDELADATTHRRQPHGLEFEITEELAKSAPAYRGGLIVPARRAGLDSATATKGAELKFQEPMTWVDMLRIESVVVRAGATFLDNLWGGSVAIPRITGQTAPVWAAQNPGSDQAQNDPTFGLVQMNPKILMANTAFTKQLLVQSRVNEANAIDHLIESDIARAHAVLLDGAAVGGTGAGNQPTGVATQLAGAQLIAFGANGGQATWANYVDIEAAVAAANSDYPDVGDDDVWPKPICAWVTTPQIRQRARKTDRAGAATGWYIMADEGRAKLLSYPVYVSNSVPSTLTKGTANGICHAIVFGRWSDLYVGSWGSLELVVDPFSKKAQGLVSVASYQMVDIAVARLGSFAGSLDALP